MILTCPNCATQYVVKDGAIPPQGRQVSCASCKHSWHQEPEDGGELRLQDEQELGEHGTEAAADIPAEASEPYPSAEPEAEPTDEETYAEAAIIDPSAGPEAEQRAYEEAVIEGGVPPEAEAPVPVAAEDVAPVTHDSVRDDEFSPFASRDVVERKRRSPIVAILLLVVLIAAAAAAFWFLAPPEWKAKLGLVEAKTPLQLSNPPQMELVQLASGQQLLTVSGRVINPTDKAHPVPPIHAELYERGGKVIKSWTIQPPTPVLAPQSSASFNSAEVNVPSGAEGVTISLESPKA